MSELTPHRQLEIRTHSGELLHDDIVLAHTIRLAAEAAANQTIDGSDPIPFTPSENPNQILEFGRQIKLKVRPTPRQVVDTGKARILRRSLQRAKISTT